MKISSLFETSTTAGAVAPVASPFKSVIKREPMKAGKGSNLLKGIKTSAKYANSLHEGEGFQHDVDHMPGQTVKHQNTNCTACHGRKVQYKLGDKLHADNKKGATKVMCQTCNGTGDKEHTDTEDGRNYANAFGTYRYESVEEGAKVDRMVGHVKSSEKKLGKSSKEAENIAWATANKRGMLDNKNKKKVKESVDYDEITRAHELMNRAGDADMSYEEIVDLLVDNGFSQEVADHMALDSGRQPENRPVRRPQTPISGDRKAKWEAELARILGKNTDQGVAEGSGETYIIVRTDSEGKKDVFAGNFDTYERAQKELDGLLAHPLHTKYKQKFEIKRKGGEQGVAEGSAPWAANWKKAALASKKAQQSPSGANHKRAAELHRHGATDPWGPYKDKHIEAAEKHEKSMKMYEGVAEGFDDNNTEIARKLLPRLKQQSGRSTVDKCAALAAKYFNSAGLQSKFFNIDEYIKQEMAKEGVAEGLKFHGGFPDVDHMPGAVYRNGERPPGMSAPVGPPANYRDKSVWKRAADRINSEAHDDNAEIISGQGVTKYMHDGKCFAKWVDSKNAGVTAGQPLSEAEIAENDIVLAPGKGRQYKPGLLTKPEVSVNPTDTVKLDIPLLIRLLEFAKEDASDDMDLHDLAEKLVAGSQRGCTLTMKDYDRLVPEVAPKKAEPEMGEGLGGAVAGGIAGAALTKSASGAMTGANIGSGLQDALSGDEVDEGRFTHGPGGVPLDRNGNPKVTKVKAPTMKPEPVDPNSALLLVSNALTYSDGWGELDSADMLSHVVIPQLIKAYRRDPKKYGARFADALRSATGDYGNYDQLYKFLDKAVRKYEGVKDFHAWVDQTEEAYKEAMAGQGY